MIRLGVLGSTNGTDLQVIIESIKAKKLNAIVNVVISNKKNAYILKRGQNHGLPSIFINHKNKKRESFDSELTLTLKKYNVEFRLYDFDVNTVITSRFPIKQKVYAIPAMDKTK